jgi:hypothetical protein
MRIAILGAEKKKTREGAIGETPNPGQKFTDAPIAVIRGVHEEETTDSSPTSLGIRR